MGEQYVYLIRLLDEEYTMPHMEVFLDLSVAHTHFDDSVKFFRKKGWDVDDDKDYCAVNAIRRATMVRKEDDRYHQSTLIMERYDIIKK